MDDQEFYELACEPFFGDAMAFQLSCEDRTPCVTFSMDGLEGVTDQMFRFILARILARMNTGKEAKDLHFTINLDWTSKTQAELADGIPFYTAGLEGNAVIDGTHRWKHTR